MGTSKRYPEEVRERAATPRLSVGRDPFQELRKDDETLLKYRELLVQSSGIFTLRRA